MTPLAAARIAGEVGLAGGTITGSAYAVKYSGEIKSANEAKNQAQQSASQKKNEVQSQTANIDNDIKDVESKGNSLTQCVQSKNPAPSNCESALTNFQTSINALKQKTQSSSSKLTLPTPS